MPKTRAGLIAFPWSLEMDIHQLELFLAVMDSSSVTRAAEHVHLSPAATSLQLPSLAGELQTELFVRWGRRLIPPPAASRLAERARALIKQAHQMRHDFENNSSTDARPFHFATGITSLIYRLGRPLRQLRKQFPNTQIQIFVGVTERSEEHTSELQSLAYLVCRLLLEKKKKKQINIVQLTVTRHERE